tara:strand:- start:2390 stop:4309 length:1920 start_codon:yes stop_codon:yes gene_type:complete
LLATFTLFLPLTGYIISFFFLRNSDPKYSQNLTSILIILSSIFSWIILFNIIEYNEVEKINLLNWINSGNLSVSWSLRIDTLTSVMFIVVTNVSAAVHVYSIGYMKNDNSIPRFMSYLSLFTFFMLILVSSDNLLQMFFGWEGVGLTSYLLIGFWYHKKSANDAAIKAFIVNRVGDFGFLIGILGIFIIFDSIYFDEIFSKVYLFKDHKFIFLGNFFSTLDAICLFLFIGAMGKSAQIGLHTWLPDAMEGPTPVSALIHAATMVTAGVFMVSRMSPLFSESSFASDFITIIGATTAIFAATIAITQNDIKKVIAYSTCSQLGYMFFAAGLGAYNSSIFHLMTHGFFKALLFLCAGSVIHAMNNEQDMQKMGGLSKKLPITTLLMWIGTLSIIGFPFFSGYYSKESILHASFFSNNYTGLLSYIIGIITACLTALYSWRLLFLTFHGNNRSDTIDYKDAHESPLIMLIPLIFLAIGSVFAGIFFNDLFLGEFSYNFWNNSIIIEQFHKDYIPFSQSLIIKLSSIIGISLALIFYYYKTDFQEIFYKKFKLLYLISFNKWYFDEIYNFLFVKPSFIVANIFWINGDEKTIDFYGPNGISKIISKISIIFGRFQTGYLYHYAFVMIIGLSGFLTWYLYFKSL